MKYRFRDHVIAAVVYSLLQVFWVFTGGAQTPTASHIVLDSQPKAMLDSLEAYSRQTRNEGGVCLTEYEVQGDYLYLHRMVPGKITFADSLHVDYQCPEGKPVTVHTHFGGAVYGPSTPDLEDERNRHTWGIIQQIRDHDYILIVY